MRTTLSLSLLLLAGSFLAASCGDSDGSGGGPDGCSDEQIEVSYLGGDRDGETECAAIPSECGAEVDCTDNTCVGALYDLCESPYIGVSCSASTGTPTIVSCNP